MINNWSTVTCDLCKKETQKKRDYSFSSAEHDDQWHSVSLSQKGGQYLPLDFCPDCGVKVVLPFLEQIKSLKLERVCE